MPVFFDFRSRARGRSDPDEPESAGSVFGGILTLLVCAVMTAGLVWTYTDASRSNYTQEHGVRATGTVTQVSVNQSCDDTGDDVHDGCSYSTDVSLSLRTPVAGASSTTLHLQYKAAYANGQSVTVLVDPRQPDYAELPGRPDWNFKVMVPLAAFDLLALVLGGRTLILGLRKRFGR